MTRQEHVEQLARELSVTIAYIGARYRMAANLATNEVYLAPWGADVPDEELYWVALHELGHVAAQAEAMPYKFMGDEASDEAVAWLWAIDHAEFPYDQAAESAIAWGIADRIEVYGLNPHSPALERLYGIIGPEPDWFFNTDLNNPAHARKFYGYAQPAWAKLAAAYGTPSVAVTA